MADWISAPENKFYKDARNYWANIPPTIDGVLGGYGHISDTDIDGSRAFLNRIFSFPNPPGHKLVLDCGAGIGRISNSLLANYFEKIDLVEQDEKFISYARDTLGKLNNNQLGTLYNVSLQNFKPQKKYDLIWCQWVLGYLNDYDTLFFLERCSSCLAPDGVLIVKENITSAQELEYDEDDSSVTRPLELMYKIIDAAKFKIVATDIQSSFPDEIYPVHMFALVPQRKLMQINEKE